MGDEIEVKILRVDTEERKIGLSRKRVEWAEEDDAGADAGRANWNWSLQGKAARAGSQGWSGRSLAR